MQEDRNALIWPEGFTARPARLDDAQAVADVENAHHIEQIGMSWVRADWIRTSWESPRFELENDTMVVTTQEGSLVGHGAVFGEQPHVRLHAIVHVHPRYRGRGLGTALSQWVEARARQSIPKAREEARVSLVQRRWTTDLPARELLEARGYQPVRYSFDMIIEMDQPPPAPAFPEGLTVRTLKGKEELATLLKALREIYRDYWGYVERPFEEEYEELAHEIEHDPDYDPELWYLALDGQEIMGLALFSGSVPEDSEKGWCGALGVRRQWRRRGLATALLRHGFGELYQRGKYKVGLRVDAENLTGATRLFEKAGMHEEHRSVLFEKELRPGEDLAVRLLEGQRKAAPSLHQ
jgi:mycothiol synthase